MSITAMEVYGSFGEKSPLFPLERTRDGLASYCEARWPVGRRKSVAREWDLTADEARSICEGAASQTTLDKVWRHPNGGWRVLLPVMGAVIGQPIHEFFKAQIRLAEREAHRAAEHEKLASAAWGRLAADRKYRPGAARVRDQNRALGTSEARRVGEGQ